MSSAYHLARRLPPEYYGHPVRADRVEAAYAALRRASFRDERPECGAHATPATIR